MNKLDKCDLILETIYSNRPNEIDDKSLKEKFNIEDNEFTSIINKLELDGYIKIERTKDLNFINISSIGEEFFENSSYKNEAQIKNKETNSKKLKSKFEYYKGILEIVFATITIFITIYTFILNNKVGDYEIKLNKFEKQLDSIQKIQNKDFKK